MIQEAKKAPRYDWHDIICHICGCKSVVRDSIVVEGKDICYGCAKKSAKELLELID